MMKRRIFPLLLSCALSLTLLSACGGSPSGGDSASQSDSTFSENSSADQSGSATSQSGNAGIDGSVDLSSPESSQIDASGGSSAPDANQPSQNGTDKLTLNRSDFSLFKLGATFQLKAGNVPQGGTVVWTSCNEKVASVSENGTVTYVSSGSAVITATAGNLTASCKVYCKPEKDAPASGSGSGSSSTSKVDLPAFYTTLSNSYEFPFGMALADRQLQDALYSGLSAISTEQCLVYANQMSMNMGELVLVQVKDSKDVSAVKAILQARIDAMAGGSAWYPEPTELWTNCSAVVSSGNYIMMTVHQDYQSIIKDFNDLF